MEIGFNKKRTANVFTIDSNNLCFLLCVHNVVYVYATMSRYVVVPKGVMIHKND